jgi:hypothetical protein
LGLPWGEEVDGTLRKFVFTDRWMSVVKDGKYANLGDIVACGVSSQGFSEATKTKWDHTARTIGPILGWVNDGEQLTGEELTRRFANLTGEERDAVVGVLSNVKFGRTSLADVYYYPAAQSPPQAGDPELLNKDSIGQQKVELLYKPWQYRIG